MARVPDSFGPLILHSIFIVVAIEVLRGSFSLKFFSQGYKRNGRISVSLGLHRSSRRVNCSGPRAYALIFGVMSYLRISIKGIT